MAPLCVALALVLCAPAVTRADDAPSPDDTTEPAPESFGGVRVAPIEVDGTLPPQWRTALDAALAEGLSRAPLPAQPCATPPCPDTPAYRLETFVRVDDRTYDLRLVVVRVGSGSIVVEAAAACDVCGLGDVEETLVALAAGLRDRIDRLSGEAPRLRITSTPSGATVFVDDVEIGTTPVEHTADPGAHQIRLELADHRATTREVELSQGLEETVSVELLRTAAAPVVAEPPDPIRTPVPTRRPRGVAVAGWVSLGAGVAAAATGAALLSVHGRSARYRCSGVDRDIEGNCRFVHDTATGGIVSLSGALVGVAVGVTLVAIAARRREKRRPMARRRTTLRRTW